MKKRILKSTSLLVVLSILFTFVLMNVVTYQKALQQMRLAVKGECKYIKNAIEKYGEEYLTEELGGISDSRITLIDTDGTVLFESAMDSDNMENHQERPEVKAALEQGVGSNLRNSDTFDQKMYYYAMKLRDGSIIRVCRATDSVISRMYSGFTLIGVLLIGFMIAVIIVIDRTAKRLVSPMNEWDLNHPLDNGAYEELSPLLVRIDQQNNQINEQMKLLKRNQEEYLAITEYMKDGLIVTNQEVVLSINQTAQQLFTVTQENCINHNIITVSRNEDLQAAFKKALKGQSDERITNIDGRIYQLLANPVRVKDDKVSGTVILIMDVTEKQQTETMRKEFTANVSHELKTPLMSISGYAEIIQNGMVRPEDVPEFAGRIHSEAVRLTALVEDIINLSKLDENAKELVKEKVDLFEIAEEVKRCLSMKAQKMEIDFGVTGETAVIHGVRQILYEMVYNLCDNAIKYNRPSGKVYITVEKNQQEIALAVKDNGIGVPKEEQERIFERFYRVDKSHSRKIGGTGLGLSIVKNGALLHDARIEFESTPGIGSEVKIIFTVEKQ